MTIRTVFNRKKKLNAKNQALVELEIYVSAKNRKFRSTGVWVESKYWDEKKLCVKKSHPDHDLLNSKITVQKQAFEKFLLSQKFSGEQMDITIFEKRNNGSIPHFLDFFENEVIKVSNVDLTTGTNKIYKRALAYLKEYSDDIPFDELTVSYLEGFNSFLITNKKLAVNTRASLFNKVKKVVNQAVQNDYIPYSKNPFKRGFSVREVETEKKSLTLAELKVIENLDMSLRPELDKTRDMFLFSCYTSLRFGDLVSLSFENFETLPSGKIRLKYIPGKTRNINNKRIEWVVSDFWQGKVDRIIKKYFDKFRGFETADYNKRRFFQYENAVYNRNLKELQAFAKIKQNLTSHLARHTSITLLINDFGLDITKVQLIAGHSKIEMTRKYLRVTENELSAAAKKVNWDQ